MTFVYINCKNKWVTFNLPLRAAVLKLHKMTSLIVQRKLPAFCGPSESASLEAVSCKDGVLNPDSKKKVAASKESDDGANPRKILPRPVHPCYTDALSVFCLEFLR